ncbi:MAG: GNAT family N-acetyltransferase [Bacteroidaceae bacterium]|nr:GNAT family N-acetyltransferase [Bacteroidaceae bacterium]
MFEIRRYTCLEREQWDKYVAKARNATFLFYRDYMDYHSDRFEDHSLMFFVGNRLHSILPANIVGTTLYSHQGLTYGGLLMDINVTAAEVITLFQELNHYLRAHGIQKVIYKPVPWVYHQVAAEEDLYPLFWICKARLITRDIGTTIFMQQHLEWRKDRRRRLRRAQEAGIEIVRTNDFAPFWEVLETNLLERHQVRPVHTLEEIKLLHQRFPNNILQYNALLNGEVVAGMTFYLTQQVLHGQYCSSNDLGKANGAVDALHDYVMHHEFPDIPYMDFGRSTEGDGSILNEGLVAQKEGFGGRTICYDTYEWNP